MFESLLAALPTILGSVGVAKTFGASQKGINTAPQKKINNQISQLAGAMADPSSPMFQNIYNQNRQMGQASIADAIAEIQRQNRKAVSMGRTPLLDQERGGESVFRNLILGQQDQEMSARDATLRQLSGAAGAFQAPFQNAGSIAQQNFGNTALGAGGYSYLGDAIKNLFGLQKQPEQINWNTPRVNVY